MAELTDDAVADFLQHVGHVGIAGRLAREKAGLAARLGAIEVDALKKEDMKMELEIEGTAETLDKGDRPRLEVGARKASGDCLVHVILPDRGANDRMDLRGQVLGRGHPIPQGDGHRHDPLAGRHPGDDVLHEVGRGLGHAPGCTRRAKPAPLAAEGQQQLFRARVTAQAQKAMGEDATLQVGVKLPLDIRGQAGGLGVRVQ